MTTILTNLVGRSVVSAITQTPASGPLALRHHAAEIAVADGDAARIRLCMCVG